MTFKKESIFIIYYQNDDCYLGKYAKDLYDNYIGVGENITYDQFRYILKTKKYCKLNNVVNIEKYDFDDYLEPHYQKSLDAYKQLHGKERSHPSQSYYLRNKIYAQHQKEFNESFVKSPTTSICV
tara:strand:+ start:893 stop:1267 length:375 start_codon:yes stop_codon:yes gene_type:complete